MFRELLCRVDQGRFEKIVNALDVNDCCANCLSFRKDAFGQYLCAVEGSCIGCTLSEGVKDYLWTRVKIAMER